MSAQPQAELWDEGWTESTTSPYGGQWDNSQADPHNQQGRDPNTVQGSTGPPGFPNLSGRARRGGFGEAGGRGFNGEGSEGRGRGGFPRAGNVGNSTEGPWAGRGKSNNPNAQYQSQTHGRRERHSPYRQRDDRGHFEPQHDQGRERGTYGYQQHNQGHSGRNQGQDRRDQGRFDQTRRAEPVRGRTRANRGEQNWGPQDRSFDAQNSYHGNRPHRDGEGGYIDSGQMAKDGTAIRALAGASNVSSERYYNVDPMVALSKGLSWILRHAAEKNGLKFLQGGFLYVNDILKVHKFKSYTLDHVKEVVKANDKQRFFLTEDKETGKWKIRANQGHSVEVEGLELKPVESAADFPKVVHGTYFAFWERIKTQGLKRMSRNHIHFAPGEPGSDGVISGMRKSCEVLIFLNLEAALKDGLKFFLSSNNVLLTPGNQDGFIFPCYFEAVIQRYPRTRLDFDSSIRSLAMSAEEVAVEAEGKGKKNKKKKNKKGRKGTDSEENKANVAEENTETEDGTPEIVKMFSMEETADEAEDGRKKNKKKGNGKEEEEDKAMEMSHEPGGKISDMTSENEGKASESAAETSVMSEDMTDDANWDDEPQRPEPIAEDVDTDTPDVVFNLINSVESCQEIVTLLAEQNSNKTIGVACFSASTPQDQLSFVCVADQFGNIYAFDILTEPGMIRNGGPLQTLFGHDSPLTKVFHGCSLDSKILFDSHKVMLMYTPIYDSKVAFQYWLESNEKKETENSLVAVCEQFDIQLENGDAWDAGEDISDLDWSIRPLNDYMKLIIKNRVLPLLKIKSKLGLDGSDLKKAKKCFYDEAWELVDMDEVKKVHDERKRMADQAKKKDPNAQSKKKKGKK